MTIAAQKKSIRDPILFENGGERLFGVLHRPLSIQTPPLVIAFHGFASSKIGTRRSHVLLAEALAQSGVAMLRFDFRGAGDSEGSLEESTVESFLSDAECVYRSMREQGWERVGFYGSSFGGSIALLAAKSCPIGSLALWAPVATGELWFRDFIHQHPELTGLPPKTILSTYRGARIHPLFQEQFGRMRADEALLALSAVPLLHLQGEKDQVLSLDHQRLFQRARQGATAPSRFLTYPDVDHALGAAKELPKILQEITHWFKETL